MKWLCIGVIKGGWTITSKKTHLEGLRALDERGVVVCPRVLFVLTPLLARTTYYEPGQWRELQVTSLNDSQAQVMSLDDRLRTRYFG